MPGRHDRNKARARMAAHTCDRRFQLLYRIELIDIELRKIGGPLRQRLLRIPCFRSTQTTSSSVKSDCLSISVSKKFACFSSGEVLPPRGLAA